MIWLIREAERDLPFRFVTLASDERNSIISALVMWPTSFSPKKGRIYPNSLPLAGGGQGWG